MLRNRHFGWPLLSATALLIACGDGRQDGTDEPATLTVARADTPEATAGATAIIPHVTIADGFPAFGRATNLQTLLQARNVAAVAVVQVTGSEDASTSTEYVDPEDPGLADHGKYPTPDPATSIPTLTRFRGRVVTVLFSKGSADLPADVDVLQPGGLRNGIAYVFGQDRLLEVGKTYVMVLTELTVGGKPLPGVFMDFHLVRLEVEKGGRLVPAVPAYADLGAVKELAGLTVPEAQQRLTAAAAAGR